MHRKGQAKIVATLGPASSDPASVRALFEAGADVFRLNFRHGTRADHEERHRTIRGLESEYGRPIGILQDLQGSSRLADLFSFFPKSPEEEAMALFNLKPPRSVAGLKKPYNELVKQHHPDTNGGDNTAEKRPKSISRAYDLLQLPATI